MIIKPVVWRFESLFINIILLINNKIQFFISKWTNIHTIFVIKKKYHERSNNNKSTTFEKPPQDSAATPLINSPANWHQIIKDRISQQPYNCAPARYIDNHSISHDHLPTERRAIRPRICNAPQEVTKYSRTSDTVTSRDRLDRTL